MTMSPFFFFFGGVLGLILSVTMVPGAVWCVQMTLHRGWVCGVTAGAGIALAQMIWATVAALMVFSLAGFSNAFDWVFRVVAASILLYMCATVYGAPPIQTLRYEGPVRGAMGVFRKTFGIALTMPMRLPGYVAIIIAVSLHLRRHDLGNAALLGMGAGLGSMAWWLYFSALAALFGHRVPEPITLRSMNKLRILSTR